MSAMGGGAIPVAVTTRAKRGGPAMRVYGYDSAAEAKAGGHTPIGGPALPVVVLTDADLKQNGGTWVLEGTPQAMPVYTAEAGRAVEGGPALAVYPVNAWPTGSTTVWQDVDAPTGWTWSLPFTIQQKGNVFRVDPTFNLETYANITVAKTYWVKPAAEGGNDANTGADEAHALARINTALNLADSDCIMVKAGTYYYGSNWGNMSPARSKKVIGYGGKVISTTEKATYTWTAVDSHYEASEVTSIGVVVDFATPDADGDGIPLTRQVSVALVDANPGSWYYDAVLDIIYVRTTDSRAPDASIHCYVGDQNGRMNDAVTYYVEGVEFHGGANAFLGDIADANAKLYFKDCAFKYTSNAGTQDIFSISGLGEVICENCIAAHASGDGFKIQASGAIAANLALISSIGRRNGVSGSTNANGYTRHGPGNTVAVNCEFHSNFGPNVRDITNGTLTWLLACYGHDPAAAAVSINFSIGNTSTMWLDTCISEDATVADVQASEATSVLKYRNMTPATPTTAGSGTFTTY